MGLGDNEPWMTDAGIITGMQGLVLQDRCVEYRRMLRWEIARTVSWLNLRWNELLPLLQMVSMCIADPNIIDKSPHYVNQRLLIRRGIHLTKLQHQWHIDCIYHVIARLELQPSGNLRNVPIMVDHRTVTDMMRDLDWCAMSFSNMVDAIEWVPPRGNAREERMNADDGPIDDRPMEAAVLAPRMQGVNEDVIEDEADAEEMEQVLAREAEADEEDFIYSEKQLSAMQEAKGVREAARAAGEEVEDSDLEEAMAGMGVGNDSSDEE